MIHPEHSPEFTANEAKEQSFDFVSISIASPEEIVAWTGEQFLDEVDEHGNRKVKGLKEVKSPETINYRSFKPEPNGLFCQRIFGPVRDYECYCGKYKKVKYKDVVCDKCGVEVTVSRVRRERMGYIRMAIPVSHIWFLKSMPSRLSLMLDMTTRQLEQVIYYQKYLVVDPGQTGMVEKELLDEEGYRKAVETHGPDAFKARMGAEALQQLLKKMDLAATVEGLRDQLRSTRSKQIKKKIARRMKIIQGFLASGKRPEHMILTVLPVIPPDLRPLVPLEGGRFATSDLNDLYRRVINRNNRLKQLIQMKTPDVIIHNEMRMLQEAVDALLDNGRHGKPVKDRDRQLKSISDMLKGKHGRFRQNLLGKRVDYSGRSVIVIGPELKLNQCGLPKKMALVLFEPFIIRRLKDLGFAHTVRGARKHIEQKKPEVWDILEEVTKGHPVFLNRAPTLHRLSIQAFEPVLIEGDAIRLHPLVCTAYNADFDGDQMAVHVPLSLEAIMECKLLMMSTNNIFSPSSGKPILTPSQDIVLGAYYLTLEPANKPKSEQHLPVIGSVDEANYAEAEGALHFHDWVRYANPDLGRDTVHGDKNARTIVTTVGRIIFNTIWPSELGFFNETVKKGQLGDLILKTYKAVGKELSIPVLDALKDTGFRVATKAGISIGVSDMIYPAEKDAVVKEATIKVREYQKQNESGTITNDERRNKVVDTWSSATNTIAQSVYNTLAEAAKVAGVRKGDPRHAHRMIINPVYAMMDSGARGNKAQVKQLCGARGLMAKPSGEIIERPILSSFREGLSVLEYFISTHGARKGLSDTALKTADAGYMTRKLCDVAMDVIVTDNRNLSSGSEVIPLSDAAIGRHVSIDVSNPSGAVKPLIKADATLTEETVAKLRDAGIDRVAVRLPNGVWKSTIYDGDEILVPLADRIIGRCPSDDVVNPLNPSEIIIAAGELITEDIAKAIEKSGIDRVKVLSPLTHMHVNAIPPKSYGLDPSTGRIVERGTAVGIIAAQSIGEPGTQLTMRTFHIGGVAQLKTPEIKTEINGRIEFVDINTVPLNDALFAVNGTGLIRIVGEANQPAKEYRILAGTVIKVKDGQAIKKDQLIAAWDPNNTPILANAIGKIRLIDMINGVTYNEERDTAANKFIKSIIEHSDEQNPQIQIVNEKGENLGTFSIPAGARVVVEEGTEVEVGTLLARIPRQAAKTQDITAGLPRISELFEARPPKDAAEIAKIDGEVEFQPSVRGKKRLVIKDSIGREEEHLIPHGKHINVVAGEKVKQGQPLTDGAVDPHDILDILGQSRVQDYLITEIQKVYRSQGVVINDKHIEIIVARMLRKVRITEPGDSDYLWGEHVDRSTLAAVNRSIHERGGQIAEYEPILLGITKASLETESFISAASFQETTRVLTDAATMARRDPLTGFKENVIMGHLVPAGTGLPMYRKIKVTPTELTAE
ncbi:MAG: DNA-directed RNA polymerase subunit beta' [Opitutia bacterium]|nr:DNA-directed RNA polymerase subunit beta' [Opitutales bacterium]PHX68747.1 MAG: DNA-directed RNA polymerase subunit beta' [Opitutae bacterium]